MMLCPSCKTNLTMSERQGIEIDYCPSCRGVWLDRGELDKIIERSAESAPPQHHAPPPPPQGYQQPWGGAGHDPRYQK
jgi:Zn-finger nucleic acid-binding protein